MQLKTGNFPTLPVKLIPPEPGHYFVRQSLIEKLTAMAKMPGKVWISSPGGSGKTAMVRNFLINDPRKLFWYQVDHTDRDLASLFFYLSRFITENKAKSLPQFSPEYLLNLEQFCRNFCRKLFNQIGNGFVLVFDDAQEGPGEALFGPFLSAAMAELPLDSLLLVISREEPYRTFARNRLNNSLAHLNWEDMRLSEDEVRHFLVWSCNSNMPQQQALDHAYDLTQGWLAGLMLYSQNVITEERSDDLSMERTDLLFDFFAHEVFGHFTAETQKLLYSCSLLPAIDVAMVEALTGIDQASAVLRELVRNNNFTYRVSAQPETYRLHPLFKQFLHTSAVQALDIELITHYRKKASALLMAAGQAEPAADLMIAVGDWPQLQELIRQQAETLLQQRRIQTLLQWLDALPEQLRNENPWLCYWRGRCLMTINPAQAMKALNRAFELFDHEADVTGSMLSWSAVIDTIVVVWNDYNVLDHWIERFDQLSQRYPGYPSAEVESVVVQSIFKALAYRNPARPDLPEWEQRLEEIITVSNDFNFRLIAGSNLILYRSFSGDITTAQALAELLNQNLSSQSVDPLKKVIWLGTRAILEMIALNSSGLANTLRTGRTIIQESGLHLMDVRLHAPSIITALTMGDLTLAESLLKDIQAAPVLTSSDKCLHSMLLANLSLVKGEPTKAIAQAETAVKLSSDGGNVAMRAFSMPVLIMALYEGGQIERASLLTDNEIQLADGLNYFKSYFLLLAAGFALEKGETEKAHAMLQAGLGIAAQQRYCNFMPWRDAIMLRLCREAIAADIEVDYVHWLASRHGLVLAEVAAPALTPKELEVLTWVQEGKTNREIAQIMDISEGTVKFHIRNMLRKLGAKSRAQAIAIALKVGLISEK